MALNPKGIEVEGVIQFDSVVRLKPMGERPPTVLYIRYWVSSTFYHFSITWSEPQGRRLRFPVPASGLWVSSTTDSFEFGHTEANKLKGSFTKPFGNQPDFSYKFGHYPIDELRFIDDAMKNQRLETSFFAEIQQLTNSLLKFDKAKNDETVSAIIRSNALSTLEIRDDSSVLQKKIEYMYRTAGDDSILRQSVYMPPHQMSVMLKGDGASVRINTNSYRVKKFPIMRRPGGNNAIIDYTSKGFGQTTLSIPESIKIYSENTNIIKSAHFESFEVERYSTGDLKKRLSEATGIGVFEILSKYGGGTRKLPEATLNQLEQSCERLSAIVGDAATSLGERLKSAHILVQLGVVLEDLALTETSFRKYLELLVGDNMDDLLLPSGYSLIEKIALHGYDREADILSDTWLEIAKKHVSNEIMLRFAISEFHRQEFFAAYQVLNSFPFNDSDHVGYRFEKSAILAVASYQLLRLNGDDNLMGYKLVQSKLMRRRLDQKELEDALHKYSTVAKREMEQIQEPSPLQIALRKELEKILFAPAE